MYNSILVAYLLLFLTYKHNTKKYLLQHTTAGQALRQLVWGKEQENKKNKKRVLDDWMLVGWLVGWLNVVFFFLLFFLIPHIITTTKTTKHCVQNFIFLLFSFLNTTCRLLFFFLFFFSLKAVVKATCHTIKTSVYLLKTITTKITAPTKDDEYLKKKSSNKKNFFFFLLFSHLPRWWWSFEWKKTDFHSL